MKDAIEEILKAVEKLSSLLLSLPTIENEDESNDVPGEEMKTGIPSTIIDICTRLEVLLGLKLSGHTENLKEASILKDELYKSSENQNEYQNRKALDTYKS